MDLIKSYNYRGLPIAIVKKIAREVLLGLDYLHSQCDIIHTDLKPENVLISRTKPINIQQLELEKNREIKKQYERQLKRFEQQMDHNNNNNNNNHRKQMSKNQKKKLRQKMNELKKNISNIDKKYIILLREHNELKEEDDKDNDILNNNDKKIKPQFEFIHGRCISTIDDENNGKMYSASSQNLISPIAKICDLGNACWIDKHFTDDITTRQYRAPESILQVGYNTKVDIWSHACMIFELITGDYLFDPREKEQTKDDYGYSRDEDHLALIGELCGKLNQTTNIEYNPWPIKWTKANDKSFNIKQNDSFDIYLKKLRSNIKRPGLVSQFFGGYKIIRRDGQDSKWDFTKCGDQLSNIQKLDYWSLAAVLEEKYKIPNQKKTKKDCKNVTSGHQEAEQNSLAHFLGRMLEIDPSKRATAKEMLSHPWLVINKQDIEECYKAECKWFKSNGKPTTDTNANYGISSFHKNNKKRNSKIDQSSTTDNDDYDDDDDDDESSDDDDLSSDDDDDDDNDNDEDDESIFDDRSRSRESSVDGRDAFANRRAESEPPPTWHKYLGIKWYQQFEDIAPHQDTHDFDDEFNSKFEGLNINGIKNNDDDNDDQDELKHNGNGYHNGHHDDGDDGDDEEDLYAMDPDFDPHADNDNLEQDAEPDDNDNDDDDDEDDGESSSDDLSDGEEEDDEELDNTTKHKRKVTLEISNDEEDEDKDQQTPLVKDFKDDEYVQEFERFTRNGISNGNLTPMDDNNGFHEAQSSVIFHGDGNEFTLEQLGIDQDKSNEIMGNEQEPDDQDTNGHINNNSNNNDDNDHGDEELKDNQDHNNNNNNNNKVFDSKHRRKNSSDDKMKYITNPNIQPFFNEFNENNSNNNNNNDNDNNNDNNNNNNNGHRVYISNLSKAEEQEMAINRLFNNGNGYFMNNTDEFGDDVDENELGDNLASLPQFKQNNPKSSRGSQPSISISSNGSHSRVSSSASTLDID